MWSYLTKGDAAYTLVQVSLNDIIMLFAFAPIVVFLLGISDIQVPWDTVISVVLYIVIPLAGYVTRRTLIARRGEQWYDEVFMKRLGPVTPAALIATLVLLFAFQGEVILENPVAHRADCRATDHPDRADFLHRLRRGPDCGRFATASRLPAP